MKLFKASILSILTMWGAVVLFYWITMLGYSWQIEATIGAAFVSSITIIIVFIFWVLPVHALLSANNKIHLRWYVIAAFIPGPIFVIFVKPFSYNAPHEILLQSVLCGFVGIIGAIVFWKGIK